MGDRYSEALGAISKYIALGPEHLSREWSSDNFKNETVIYQKHLHGVFPELSDRAINAHASQWSFGWR